MFKLKPKKKAEAPPVYKFVPLKPNPALAMGAIAPVHKVSLLSISGELSRC